MRMGRFMRFVLAARVWPLRDGETANRRGGLRALGKGYTI
jgi:hypothetical protein